MNYRKLLLGAAVVLPFFTAQKAEATLLSFTGSGQFTNISGCSTVPACNITDGGTFLDMSGFNNSTLMAPTRSGSNISIPPNQNDLVIGEIDWVNNESTYTDQNFTVNYTFTLAFTSPTGHGDSQSFNLQITQPTNPPGDRVNINNAILQGLDIGLAGLSVSDLHFSTNGAGGST
jgi:hypothetical protein